jgi:hypothetical protein
VCARSDGQEDWSLLLVSPSSSGTVFFIFLFHRSCVHHKIFELANMLAKYCSLVTS